MYSRHSIDEENQMPRFYFNVYNGSNILDIEGTEFADQSAACREAVRLSGMIIADDIDHVLSGMEWYMELTDSNSAVVLRISLTTDPRPPICAATKGAPEAGVVVQLSRGGGVRDRLHGPSGRL